MLSGMGIAESDDGIDTSLQEYKHRRQVYVFDLQHMRHEFPNSSGIGIKVELKFNAGTSI